MVILTDLSGASRVFTASDVIFDAVERQDHYRRR
jgi:hypothetical protein